MNNIYQDQNNLSEKELKAGYWWVTHKLLIKKILLIAFIVVDAILILVGIGGFVYHYVWGIPQIEKLQVGILDNQLNQELIQEINNPLELDQEQAFAFHLGGNKFDLVATVTNPNEKWTIESLDYYFIGDNWQSEKRSNYVFPGETVYLMALEEESDQFLYNAELVVENIKWKKVVDFKVLKEKINRFEVTDKKFISADQSGLSDKLKISQVKFKVENKSAYNFWQVGFSVLLYQGSNLKAVNEFNSNDWQSGELKNLGFNLYQNLPTINNIVIIPRLNILEPNNYKAFEAVGSLK